MKKGFSLIELMATVLIIGILASIALPQYRKAIERARTAEILSVANYVDKMARMAMTEHSLDRMADCTVWLSNVNLRAGTGTCYKGKNATYCITTCNNTEVDLRVSRKTPPSDTSDDTSALYWVNWTITKDGFNVHTTFTCTPQQMADACRSFFSQEN